MDSRASRPRSDGPKNSCKHRAQFCSENSGPAQRKMQEIQQEQTEKTEDSRKKEVLTADHADHAEGANRIGAGFQLLVFVTAHLRFS